MHIETSKANDPINPTTGLDTVQVQVEQTNSTSHVTSPSAIQAQPTHGPTCSDYDKILLNANKIKSLLSKLTKSSDSLPAVHNFLICTDAKCLNLRHEKAAFKADGSRDKFKHHWLSASYWWACFVEEGERQGMFCILCLKYNSKSSLNKASNTFIDVPSKRYKVTALSDHKQSGIHARSIESQHLQRI